MKKLIGISLFVLVVGAVVLAAFASVPYHDNMVRLQNGLNAKYDDNRQILASAARRIETKVGVANVGMDKLSKLFSEAGASRYKNDGSSGSLMKAVHEAYPSVDASVYQTIIKEVDVQEDVFENAQRGLRSTIQEFDNQRETFWNEVLNAFPWNDFPNNNLIALGPNGTLHGTPALDQMRSLVTSAESNKAYETNQYDGPQIPKN